MVLIPLQGERALFDEESKMIVIGDIHLGFELTLLDRGIHIPNQDKVILAALKGIIGKTGCRRLIINGDAVDPLFRKWRIRERFQRFIQAVPCEEIHIVKGNHDARIEEILPPGVNLHPSDGLRIGDVAILHGHRKSSRRFLSCKTIIISHSHPALILRDELGIPLRESCWLRWMGKNQEIIVIPPFNPYMVGHPVNSIERKPSPVFNQMNAGIDDCDVYLLDGSYLGKVSDLIRYAYSSPS